MASAYVPGSIWMTVPGPTASTAAWIELPALTMTSGRPSRSADGAGGASSPPGASHAARAASAARVTYRSICSSSIANGPRLPPPQSRAGQAGPPCQLEYPLPVPRHHHVSIYHIAHDPRDEGVAAGFRRQPALPLELVQRLRERVSDDARGPPERRSCDPARQHRRCYQHTLRLRRQTSEVDPDRRHDVVRELTRQRLLERFRGLRPRWLCITRLETGCHRVQHRDYEEGNARGIRHDPTCQAVPLLVVVRR